MHRCLQLALAGIETVSPNPMVGCVIVHGNEIIGEGYHQKFGEAHAEVNAINAVKNKALLPGSALYVNLEPCSHFGKTPPCSDLIISSGIRKVVVGMEDPFPEVMGKGIRKLRQAGIEVVCGVLEQACQRLNKRFICAHTHKRPYLILKWAQNNKAIMGSRNGKIQISNSISKIFTHKWRSEERGLLVGSGTVLIDNPLLNVRYWDGPSPGRLILDRSGNLCEKTDLHIFDGGQKTIVFTQQENLNYPNAEVLSLSPYSCFISEVLGYLYQNGIHSVLVEGGSKILHEFIHENYWDECRIFISHQPIENGIPAPPLPPGEIINETTVFDNTLIEVLNRHWL